MQMEDARELLDGGPDQSFQDKDKRGTGTGHTAVLGNHGSSRMHQIHLKPL